MCEQGISKKSGVVFPTCQYIHMYMYEVLNWPEFQATKVYANSSRVNGISNKMYSLYGKL